MKDDNKIILTDVDGVLLNWIYAFRIWMENQGFTWQDSARKAMWCSEQFGISDKEAMKYIKIFNESAAMGFLPPLRDAIHYVKKLHEEHGYVFHAITSMGQDSNAKKLRKMNLRKLFGETVFEEFVFLETGHKKRNALSKYIRDDDIKFIWIEDDIENAQIGKNFGMDSILMEHAYNMHESSIPLVKNWKEIYEYIV